MSLRRLTVATAVLAPALLTLPVSPAGALPLPLPVAEDAPGDHLTITVTDSGKFDGTHTLYCHPTGGTYSPAHAEDACAQLDGETRWGKDPFAPVRSDETCTMIYGGDARARVEGRWAGRPVKADFNRTNGCEMARWNTLSSLFENPKSTPKN
ncbi:SSI family serine proteinase inhibitor [Streptomyces stramineus]|uniref:Subtilisin inhibitor domain-containing protein n=1 Tax=Streptomyces stramineus TaxID=173861 RepID=A0ABN1BHX2_9ACTN